MGNGIRRTGEVGMIDREKIKTGIFEMLQRNTWKDIDKERHRFQPVLNDALALLKEQEAVTGETSDGYHTFNELYHHRAVLFSVIVANYPDRAWKSKKHHDGTMYDGMFIVGIEAPDGQATYHYDIDPYWDMFKCRVLDNAPEWDGHTPAQAIERIGKLKEQETVVRCKDCRHCYFASNRIPCEQSLMCAKTGNDITPDWFCADGEREEGR